LQAQISALSVAEQQQRDAIELFISTLNVN
jgi:hypothetical protein